MICGDYFKPRDSSFKMLHGSRLICSCPRRSILHVMRFLCNFKFTPHPRLACAMSANG